MANIFERSGAGFLGGLGQGIPAGIQAGIKKKALEAEAERIKLKQQQVDRAEIFKKFLSPEFLSQDPVLAKQQLFQLARDLGVPTNTPEFKESFSIWSKMADTSRAAAREAVENILHAEGMPFDGTRSDALMKMLLAYPKKGVDMIYKQIENKRRTDIAELGEAREAKLHPGAVTLQAGQIALGEASLWQKVDETDRARVQFDQEQADRANAAAEKLREKTGDRVKNEARALAGSQAAGATGTPTPDSLALAMGTLLSTKDFEGATAIGGLIAKVAPDISLKPYVDKAASKKAGDIVVVMRTPAEAFAQRDNLGPVPTGFSLTVDNGRVEFRKGIPPGDLPGPRTTSQSGDLSKQRIQTAGSIGRMYRLALKARGGGKGLAGLPRMLGKSIGGFFFTFNEQLGDLIIESATGLSQTAVDDFILRVQNVVVESIPIYTGEEGARVSTYEQEVVRKLEGSSKAIGNIKQAEDFLWTTLKLNVMREQGLALEETGKVLWEFGTDLKLTKALVDLSKRFPGITPLDLNDLVKDLQVQHSQFQVNRWIE